MQVLSEIWSIPARIASSRFVSTIKKSWNRYTRGILLVNGNSILSCTSTLGVPRINDFWCPWQLYWLFPFSDPLNYVSDSVNLSVSDIRWNIHYISLFRYKNRSIFDFQKIWIPLSYIVKFSLSVCVYPSVCLSAICSQTMGTRVKEHLQVTQ